MRKILFIGVALVLAGCLKSEKAEVPRVTQTATPQASAQATPPAASLRDGKCYTVDLFTPEKIRKPAKDVPEEYRAFLGRWSGGAWNDVWCHDLLVYQVHKDGRADLVEMHAPYEPWGQPATAFNRVARIDQNGNLRFSQGVETTSYRIEYGYLVGERSGQYGNLKITLYNGKNGKPPPIPRPKPVRLAEASATPPNG